MDEPFPCFLDIEASSFDRASYPIDIAWSDAEGEIHRCLVAPAAGWTDWDPAAEAVHGIDRARLERNGWDPGYVAARIEEDLRDQVVYTDAPEFDRRWLERLFVAVERPLPCRLEHVDELLLPVVRGPDEMAYQAMLRVEALKRDLQPRMSGKHSAGYDVGYLLALWRRANGEAVKMNHGIGRLPESSPTGTFMPIKRRQQRVENDQQEQ